MTPEELIKYELPCYSEFVSIGWIQTLIAWWYAKKVNRKLKRYRFRQEREAFFNRLRVRNNI